MLEKDAEFGVGVRHLRHKSLLFVKREKTFFWDYFAFWILSDSAGWEVLLAGQHQC